MAEKSLKQVDLHRISGESTGAISTYVLGKKFPGAHALINIANALDVRPGWLLTGKGPQFERSPEAQGDHTIPVLNTWKALRYDVWENFDDFSIYDGQMLLDDGTLAQLGRNDTRGLNVLRNEGDAMWPLISDGASVIIDRLDNKAREGVYAFVMGDDIRIRRLRRVGLNDIQAIPANATYEPETYTGELLDHFRVIGRAIWTGTRL